MRQRPFDEFRSVVTDERSRLRLLAEIHDVDSRDLLSGVPVVAGMHCLEVGAGLGTMAIWLADEVGPVGSVVATETSPDLLSVVIPSNLEVRRHDVTTEPFEPMSFDCIYARYVLHLLPERDAVLDQLTAALRPGGVLVVETPQTEVARSVGTPAVQSAWNSLRRCAAAVGVDLDWGTELLATLDKLGMRTRVSGASSRYYRGGSPDARLWASTFVASEALLTAYDHEDEARIEMILADLAEPTNWFAAPALLGVVAVRDV